MLGELDSEYGELVCFTNVSWLSCTATLKIFWDLRSKIKNFMKKKRDKMSPFLMTRDF